MNDPGESGNPLQGMLGDLLKLIGGTSGQVPWMEAARSLAHGVATDGGGDTNVDPIERMKLEELTRIAELYVSEATGSTIGPGDARVRLLAVSRAECAVRTLESWQPIIQTMVNAQEDVTSWTQDLLGSNPEGSEDDGDGGPFGLQNLLGQFASTLGPVFLALQFGSASGHLAQLALGQYEIPIPWPKPGEVIVVPQNIAAFAADWSLPEDTTRLWVCVRELTVHSMITRPEIAAQMTELLEGAALEVVSVQQGLAERLGGSETDPERLQSLLSDPEELLSDLLSPGQRATSERLSGLVSVLGAYADHVTAGIAKSTMGLEATLSEAWYRHRIEGEKGQLAAGSLLGIDLSREQVDRGTSFVKGVIERAGEDGLARLFSSSRTLPTPAEVDAPGLWLERINLPEEHVEEG